MPQDKDELLQVLITQYTQMYMKLAYAIGVPFDDVEDMSWRHSGRSTGRIMVGSWRMKKS